MWSFTCVLMVARSTSASSSWTLWKRKVHGLHDHVELRARLDDDAQHLDQPLVDQRNWQGSRPSQQQPSLLQPLTLESTPACHDQRAPCLKGVRASSPSTQEPTEPSFFSTRGTAGRFGNPDALGGHHNDSRAVARTLARVPEDDGALVRPRGEGVIGRPDLPEARAIVSVSPEL